jgi:hypothetical protein
MDVYPSLTYRDVSAAMDFLQRAFGFAVEEVGTEEGGAVCYAAMRHGGGVGAAAAGSARGVAWQPSGPGLGVCDGARSGCACRASAGGGRACARGAG